jgi:hypothetical protein
MRTAAFERACSSHDNHHREQLQPRDSTRPSFAAGAKQLRAGPARGSVIAAGGGSVTINANCGGGSIKVIAEDHQGCFLYQVVVCNESATWTITNDAVPDCGN